MAMSVPAKVRLENNRESSIDRKDMVARNGHSNRNAFNMRVLLTSTSAIRTANEKMTSIMDIIAPLAISSPNALKINTLYLEIGCTKISSSVPWDSSPTIICVPDRIANTANANGA